MTGDVQTISTILFWVVIPTSLLLWLLAMQRKALGSALVSREERREVPWQVIDLLGVAFVVAVCLLVAASFVADHYGMTLDSPKNWSAKEHLAMTVGSSCGILAGSLIGMFVIWIRFRVTAADLGFSLRPITSDLRLGVVSFVMLIVPVTAIQFVLSYCFPTTKQHPFVEIIVADPDPRYILIVAVLAIVIAPLCEELLFRVILQGWLEKLQRVWHDSFVAGEELASRSPHASKSLADPVFSSTDARPGNEHVPTVDRVALSSADAEKTTYWLPILISSVAFAAAHLGHGWAPVPLFFLAIGLGYLYQKTHRIWPCLIVHALVNSFAVLNLLLLVEQMRNAS